MEKLRSNLDVVEIVIGFLSSGGGRTDKLLAEYIRTLKMPKKSFSKKVKDYEGISIKLYHSHFFCALVHKHTVFTVLFDLYSVTLIDIDRVIVLR